MQYMICKNQIESLKQNFKSYYYNFHLNYIFSPQISTKTAVNIIIKMMHPCRKRHAQNYSMPFNAVKFLEKKANQKVLSEFAHYINVVYVALRGRWCIISASATISVSSSSLEKINLVLGCNNQGEKVNVTSTSAQKTAKHSCSAMAAVLTTVRMLGKIQCETAACALFNRVLCDGKLAVHARGMMHSQFQNHIKCKS